VLVGHIAVALAAKPVVPRASLGALLAATSLLDLLCAGFVAAGIERIVRARARASDDPGKVSNPRSHGLLMSGVWSGATAAVAKRHYEDRWTASVIGAVVFSHWLLDFVAHAPDLPVLFSDTPAVGLGLEYSSAGEIHLARGMAVEVGLLAIAIALYRFARMCGCRTAR
jgi:hypothetical protein